MIDLIHKIKIGVIENSGTIKELAAQALDNPKIQGSVLFGGLALSQIETSHVVAFFSIIGSITFTIKLYRDGLKSESEKEKIDLEITLMREKDAERKKRLREAEEAGISPRRKSDTD